MIQLSYSYDLPIGRGRPFLGNMPRWADLIIGGWKTNGIWRIADGRPLSFFLDDGGQPLPTYGDTATEYRGNTHGVTMVRQTWVEQVLRGTPLTITPFRASCPFYSGECSASAGQRPFTVVLHGTNLSVGKQFRLREQMNFEFRVEAKNAFNHPVFGTPDTTVGDDTFGKISSTQLFGPREVQLGFKFNF